MKYFLFTILFASFFSCTPKLSTSTNVPISANEEQIMKDLVQGVFDDIWGGMDSTKLLNYHTEDFIILENGEVWDNARITQWMEDRLKKGTTTKRVNRMEFLSIDKYGPSIQAAYHKGTSINLRKSVNFI